MIELNEIRPYGYGMFLYSPDVLTDFLKEKKCRAKKLLTYFDKNKNVFLSLLKPVLHCRFISYPYTTIRFLYLSMKPAKPCPRVGNKYIDMMIFLSRWETAINCALRLLTTFNIIKT